MGFIYSSFPLIAHCLREGSKEVPFGHCASTGPRSPNGPVLKVGSVTLYDAVVLLFHSANATRTAATRRTLFIVIIE